MSEQGIKYYVSLEVHTEAGCAAKDPVRQISGIPWVKPPPPIGTWWHGPTANDVRYSAERTTHAICQSWHAQTADTTTNDG